jgi:hypothetical protein
MSEETASWNVSTEPLKRIGCDSRFHSDIVLEKTVLVFQSYGNITKDKVCMFYDSLNGRFRLSWLLIATYSFAILFIMTSRALFRLTSRLGQFKGHQH